MTAETSRPTGRRKRKRNEWGTLVHLSLGRVQIRWTCPGCTLADDGAQIRHRSQVLADEDAGKIRRAELQAGFLRDPATVCPEWLAAQQAQAPPPPDVHTIQEAFGQCWLELEEELSPTTLRTYEGNWNRHVRDIWGPREVKSVRAGEISAWRAQLGATSVCHRGKAPRRGACNPDCGCRTAGQCNAACGCSCGCSRLGKTAINESMAVMSAILAWCVERNWVETNEVIASHARRRRKRGRLQTPPVVSGNGVAGVTRANRAVADWKCAHALVLYMPDLFKLIPLIAAYAGLRPSEILGLRRCDVDVENCQLLVVTVNLAAKGGMKTRLRQKGGTAPGREVPIPQELMDLIVEFLKSSFVSSEEDALLFPSPRPKNSWGRTVKSVNTRYVARMVELARTAAGLSDAVTLNALRKAGENIVKDAVGGKEAALWAGHDLVVAEASYHLARTRVTMPKEVQKALTSAWRIAAADLGDHETVRTTRSAS